MSTNVSAGIADALRDVSARIDAAAKDAQRTSTPRLVAVSKTKPAEMVQAAYGAGQRHFGENYVQELVTKASTLPADIRWHFIGALQSNKAKLLLNVPNLYLVESVDREKTASALNKAAGAAENRTEKLRVLVQVNTSGEESKAGCAIGTAAELAEYVAQSCEHLVLAGLMTIGAPDKSYEPAAFASLVREREAVAARLGVEAASLELSMGMSGDFEAAVRMGSDSVRVGSLLFGARQYPA